MLLRPIPVAVTTALALALLLSACGEEGVVAGEPVSDDPVAADAVELRLSMGAASAEEVDEAAEVVRARLDSLGIEGSSVEASADGIEVLIAPGDEGLVREALLVPGVLEFRPVLATVGTVGAPGATTTPGAPAPDAEVTLAADDGAIYRLGPVALDGRALERATAGESNGMWTVSPVFRAGAEGIDRFNAITAVCYAGEPTCPPSTPDSTGSVRGSLAIVVDGAVLSAPMINTPRFERDQISISGSFDETTARALAAALDAGAPATWSLPD